MTMIGRIIGGLAGVASIVLCIIFSFLNPYVPYTGLTETDVIIFFVLFLPACLAIFAAFAKRNRWLFIAFFCALPFSAYLYFTPGIFSLFGITCLLYLLGFLLRLLNKKELKNLWHIVYTKFKKVMKNFEH